ncbi:hypothetical protein AB6A40_011219 [Gnathostoma spinigerum]|uniref:Uncharacterized protein n=1 Tax=Gnathostoma spinigerum TaxID=75299 RepID=A0ABD6F4F3_9BILA
MADMSPIRKRNSTLTVTFKHQETYHWKLTKALGVLTRAWTEIRNGCRAVPRTGIQTPTWIEIVDLYFWILSSPDLVQLAIKEQPFSVARVRNTTDERQCWMEDVLLSEVWL